MSTFSGEGHLAFIAQQEQREAEVKVQRAELKAARQVQCQGMRQVSNEPKSDKSLDTLTGRQTKRRERMDALLAFYQDNPEAGPSDVGRSIGVSRQTVYTYLAEMERSGRIVRDDGRVKVVQQARQ